MIEIVPADPRTPEAMALLEASRLLMDSLFAAEDNHYMTTDELAARDVAFFLALLDNTPVGCGALKEAAGYGEVKAMFVAPEARGRGVGAALIERIEKEARARGLRRLMLETGDLLHDALRLYARQGFRVRGPFGDYPESDSSIYMEKELA